MTWWVVLALAAGTFTQRIVGMFGLGSILDERPRPRRVAELIPAAIVAAVIIQVGFTKAGSLTVDARAVGLAVAGFLVWRRAPLVVVVVAAAAVTAIIRAVF